MEPYLKNVELYYLSRFWGDLPKIKALNSFMIRKPICWNCNGSAKVKDHTQRCVVEGLKDADLIPCSVCVRGVMPMEHVLECYKDEVAHYKEKVIKYKNDLAVFKSIMSKLTPEEIEYLNK